MHDTLETLLELLIAATAVALLARRLGLPYSTILVVAGLGLAYFQVVPRLALGPEWVINLFLPVLLFDAAINLELDHLREDAVPVSLLATVGFLAMAGLTGVLLHALLGWAWPIALLVGTMFSITDTVAVLAVFKSLGVPARLETLVEGESLFNDGTALVLFRVLLGVVLTGEFDLATTAMRIVAVSVGGLVVGGLLGVAAAWVMQRIQDPLAEIMSSTLLALGTFYLAEQWHVSGVIAVVAAGLAVGQLGMKRGLAPTSRIALQSFWEYAAFGVSSIVFLLVGLNLSPAQLRADIPAVAVGLAATMVARAAVIYPGLSLARRLGGREVPWRWRHVMVWGTLKGSLAMVLAISLPAAVPDRATMVTVTFGVVLVSLLLQGLTLGPLVRWLGVPEVFPVRQRFEREQVLLIRARAAQAEIQLLHDAGAISRSAFERLKSRYQTAIVRAERELRHLATEHQASMDAAAMPIRRRILMVEKAAILQALREQLISEGVGHEAIEAINEALIRVETEPDAAFGQETSPCT